MIGFLLAVAAGFAVPYAIEPLARPVANAARPWLHVEDAELPLLAFILLMLAVSVLAALVTGGSAFLLLLGGGVGYFAPRAVAGLRDGREP